MPSHAPRDPRTVALVALVALVIAAMIAGVVLRIVAPAEAFAAFAQILGLVALVVPPLMILIGRMQSTSEHRAGMREQQRIADGVSSARTERDE
jgi:L-asparagine transporter-like permease